MKTLHTSFISAGLIMASASIGFSQNEITWTGASSNYLDNENNWNPATQPSDLSTKDAVMNGAGITGDTYYDFTENSTIEFGSLSFLDFDGGTRHLFFRPGSNLTVEGDFKYVASNPNAWMGFRFASTGTFTDETRPIIEIKGQLLIDIANVNWDQPNQTWIGFNSGSGGSPQKLTVGTYGMDKAAIDLKQGAYLLTSVGVSGAERTYDSNGIPVADVEIKGYVNMESTTRWALNNAQTYDDKNLATTISMTGLNGNGLIYNEIGWYAESNATASSILVIKPEAGKSYEFKGTILSNIKERSQTDEYISRTDIIVYGDNGTDIDNAGKQTIRTSKREKGAFDGDITVKQGYLSFGNTNDINDQSTISGVGTRNQLTLDGGYFSAAAQDAPAEGARDIGNAYFSKLILNGGNIVVERDADNNIDKIQATSIEINADSLEFIFDFADTSNIESEQVLVGDFLDISDGITQEQIENFSGKTKDGQWIATFYWADGNQSYIEFAAIPEPATIAAILGAFALGFAAYRRRK